MDFSTVPVAFDDPLRLFIRYPGLTRDEVRWQLAGFDSRSILTVRFTLCGGIFRIIGAGYWRKQKEIYESEN